MVLSRWVPTAGPSLPDFDEGNESNLVSVFNTLSFILRIWTFVAGPVMSAGKSCLIPLSQSFIIGEDQANTRATVFRGRSIEVCSIINANTMGAIAGSAGWFF